MGKTLRYRPSCLTTTVNRLQARDNGSMTAFERPRLPPSVRDIISYIASGSTVHV
jgi:hypothetical protein